MEVLKVGYEKNEKEKNEKEKNEKEKTAPEETNSEDDLNIDEYIIQFTPNTKRLAEYIQKACGYDRTMKEFSELCKESLKKSGKRIGVSTSTFSRIKNRDLTRPLKKELIMAIYENAANKDEIDLKKLLTANGMGKPYSGDEDPEKEEAASIRSMDRRESRIRPYKEILNKELNLRNKFTIVNEVKYEYNDDIDEFGFKDEARIEIRISGDPLVRRYILMFSIGEYASSGFANSRVHIEKSDIIRRAYGLFLKDLWEPESLSDVVTTLVFDNSSGFEIAKEMFEDKTVNSNISLMYIDTDPAVYTLVEEWAIPRKDGKKFWLITDEDPAVV